MIPCDETLLLKNDLSFAITVNWNEEFFAHLDQEKARVHNKKQKKRKDLLMRIHVESDEKKCMEKK